MKNNAYWTRRANLRMEEYHKNSDSTIKKISAAYDKAIKDINEDINKIFYKYQLDSGLSTTEVRELLNAKIPKKELDSIRKRIYNIQDEELKRYMMAQLNAGAYKARITRLEALKESIYINSKLAADVEINQSTKLYTDNIKRAYYSNAFDIQKGLGVGFNIAEMPTETIQEILKNNWSGKHYSKRVWHNTDVLAKQLEEVITSGLMSGKSSRRMAQELRELTDYGKFACERLIRTETTYITNMAELESYKECGIEKYIFLATLDNRTSEQCRKKDRKIFRRDKAKVGVNLPPLHPFCRSTTRAYLGESTLKDIKRRARDPETGKTYLVPGDMTYEQWYDKFAEKSPTKKIKKQSNEAINKDGKKIEFNLDNVKLERQKLVKDTIIELADKYNTRLIGITNEAAKKGLKGSVGLDFKMNLSTTKMNTIVHEFAHSLSITKADKLGLTDDKDFWREIKKIRTQYNKAITKDKSKKISNYSLESIDEFMAEAFTQAYLKNTNELGWEYGTDYEYADKVMEVIDKYFKKI